MVFVPRAQRQYICLLAILSGAILGIGALLRPKKAPEVPVSQAEMVRLQTLTQRKSLENLSSYFAGVAREAGNRLVWVKETGTTGVVWNSAGLIVTAGPPELLVRPLSAVTSTGSGFPVEPTVYSTNFPVAALQAPARTGLPPVKRAAASRLEPGAWVVHVYHQPAGRRWPLASTRAWRRRHAANSAMRRC